MTPYERVRKSRELTAATFPLPSVLDCIRYAITELAEYDDALLRQERTGDKRNNDKAHDPRSELGQCGYMLLSAALQLNGTPQMDVAQREAPHEWEGGERLAYYIALLSDLADLMLNVWCNYDLLALYDCERAYATWWHLCDAHGWDVDAVVDEACVKFERKHAAVQEGAQ